MRAGFAQHRPPTTWAVAGLAVAALLYGCTPGESDDLARWMAQQRANAQPKIEPIRPPSTYQPQPYLGTEAISPFSDERLARVMRGDGLGSAGAPRLLESELRRRREPLEEFPLDAIAMVGLIDKAGRRVALVKVNGLLYQVAQGNYLGQNLGRVTAITDNQIVLREIVQDAAGEWVERTATLQLQEGTGK